MDTDSLLRTQSGILAFQVVSGSLARRGSLEVMLDDGYWPSFVSSRARSNTQKWDQIGEGFVRELDFSRIWFRLNAADDSAKEDIVAEFRCDTKEFLELCLGSPQEFLLSQADGSNRSVVKISARYVPVDIVLEPRESINSGYRFISR
jgi:Ca2+-dependent lipid-binding protein